MDVKNLDIDFNKLMKKYSRLIWYQIQRFNPQEQGIDPEDIHQEIKIKIWKLLNDEKPIKNFTSYIMKVVDSTVIDQIRKSRREGNIIKQEKESKISEMNMIYDLNDRELKNYRKKVHNAVDSLIESRKKVVKLFLLNMTLTEIAMLLNWSQDKTRNLLYRGLADIKKKLKNNEIEFKD